MINEYWSDRQYGPEIFEPAHPHLKLVAIKDDVMVFLDEDDGQHYTKGPFGRYWQVCYCPLGTPTPEELADWIEKMH